MAYSCPQSQTRFLKVHHDVPEPTGCDLCLTCRLFYESRRMPCTQFEKSFPKGMCFKKVEVHQNCYI
eukprot:54303-Amphidinium_carterae.1